MPYPWKQRIKKICVECGNEYGVIASRYKNSKYCDKVCQNNHYKKRFALDKNPMWKGGRRLRPDGYIEVKTANKKRPYQLEHRYVMEKHIGRELSFWEDVHHINGKKDDNRLNNLQIIQKNEHTKLHANSAN